MPGTIARPYVVNIGEAFLPRLSLSIWGTGVNAAAFNPVPS